ncbi:MAG TPA: carbohydrate porin, partial [bacterium]|nr:carbohydrate porin [bacterium]
MKRGAAAVLAALVLSLPALARAEAEQERFGAGGYFRLMTRPDFQGGDSRLGYWNLYGRLLNEGPWAALETRLNLIDHPAHGEPWAALHAKIEGGSVAGADPRGGALSQFNLTQLYVEAGNVGLRDVTWRMGTLDTWFGDLALYDMKPTEVFYQTIGASARYRAHHVDAMIGFGDSGYAIRKLDYDTIFTAGGLARASFDHFEIGAGGEYLYEPKVVGNRFAPMSTPGVSYDAFVRQEVAQDWMLAHPGQQLEFPRPVPTSSTSWKGVGYLGFGHLGPLRWNNVFANVERRHPDNFYTETYQGQTFTIFTHDLTDQRYQINVGNEAYLSIIPDRLDAIWGVLYGYWWDGDNHLAPSDNARAFRSTVVRLQYYLSHTVHLLGESSAAREKSLNGNAYRNHYDSIFQNTNGLPDTRGLQFGDSDTRDTWQGKIGVVLNPLGAGIMTRPSLRILYGMQWSSQNAAFGNSFVQNLDQYNQFGGHEQHWHQVLGVEAEAW